MFGLSEAIVGLVSAILGGEELGLTSGLYLSWTTSGFGSSGVELLGTTGSAAGGDVDTVEAFVPEPVNKPLLKLQKTDSFLISDFNSQILIKMTLSKKSHV